jgi:hypothetical protein
MESGKDVSMRRGIGEIIKEVLGDGCKNPTQLKKITKLKARQLGTSFSEPNYHYHLSKLVRLGEVLRSGEVVYCLTGEELETYRIQMKGCLRAISEADNDSIRVSRLMELKFLLARERTLHFPEVKEFFQQSLQNPEFINNLEILGKLVEAMSTLLIFEEQNPKPDSKRLTRDLIDDTRIIPLISKSPGFPNSNIIRFLGLSGALEAVDTLFEKIKAYPTQATRGSDDLSVALGDLYRIHRTAVNIHLDDLMKENSSLLSDLAKRLRERLISMPARRP